MTRNSSPSERDLDRIERHVTARRTIALREATLGSETARAIKDLAASFSVDALTAIRVPGRIARDTRSGVEVAAFDDFGPAERLTHDAVVLEGDRLTHARVLSGSVLDRMLNRRELAIEKSYNHKRLWDAGERLRNDFTLAYAEPRVVADLSGLPGGAKEEFADFCTDAKRRLQKAEAWLGRDQFHLLEEVCRNDRAPKDVIKRYGFRRLTDPMTIFRFALYSLASHYGY